MRVDQSIMQTMYLKNLTMMNKLLRKLGLKDDYGYCDPSIVGFIVIWSAFGYMFYAAVVGIIERIMG